MSGQPVVLFALEVTVGGLVVPSSPSKTPPTMFLIAEFVKLEISSRFNFRTPMFNLIFFIFFYLIVGQIIRFNVVKIKAGIFLWIKKQQILCNQI
jgi:hypothetical protein